MNINLAVINHGHIRTSNTPTVLTQDLWIPDDRPNLPQSLLSCVLHLHVGIREHFSQFGHNIGQAGRELFGSTVRHSPQQFHRSCAGRTQKRKKNRKQSIHTIKKRYKEMISFSSNSNLAAGEHTECLKCIKLLSAS